MSTEPGQLHRSQSVVRVPGLDTGLGFPAWGSVAPCKGLSSAAESRGAFGSMWDATPFRDDVGS